MRRRILLIAVSLLVAGVAFFLYLRVDRGPHHYVVFTHEYHVCDRCGSLDGGIYGKGPHKRFRSEAGGWCVHSWRPTSRDEFKRLASDWFGVDWSREIPFWSEE